MGDTASNNPFARLDTSLMRSTKSQEPWKPVSQEAVKPVLQKAINPGTLETRKRATYPKKTYHLHPDVVDVLEEIKRKLERHYHIKASREEIVEEAIRQLSDDFQKSQEASKLVIQFSGNPGTQET
jgi:hypothetical protein